MAWTGAYDEASFVAPLRRRRDELEQALLRAKDRDEADALIGAIEELRQFVAAIKTIDGPSNLLTPLPGEASGSLYRLRVGEWSAYFFLEPSKEAYYAALVEHPALPTTVRLDELRPPASGT